METTCVHRSELIEEIKKMVIDAKDEFNALSKEERKDLRRRRKEYSRRVDETKGETAKPDAFAEWLEIGIHVWDTRNPPSNIFEIEAALEIPHDKKLWLH